MVQEVGIQNWKSIEESDLQEDLEAEWKEYTNILKHSDIHLNDQDDEFRWSRNKVTWMLIANIRYEDKIREDLGEECQWWWKVVWNLESPLKYKIFVWISLENRILT